MEIREVTYLAVALRIFAAALLGGILGLDRGLKNRPAGLRTYMLVCVGSCLIMLTNQYVYQVFGIGDPVRMGAQVVSGIGFLGAGTIIVTRRSQIKGLTTAAGLWTSAGVGLALGIGFYEAALAGGLAIFSVMTLLHKLDDKMHSKAKRLDAYIELAPQTALGDFLRSVRDCGLEISNVQREHPDDDTQGNRAYIATITAAKRSNHQHMLDVLLQIPGVAYLEEL